MEEATIATDDVLLPTLVEPVFSPVYSVFSGFSKLTSGFSKLPSRTNWSPHDTAESPAGSPLAGARVGSSAPSDAADEGLLVTSEMTPTRSEISGARSIAASTCSACIARSRRSTSSNPGRCFGSTTQQSSIN